MTTTPDAPLLATDLPGKVHEGKVRHLSGATLDVNGATYVR